MKKLKINSLGQAILKSNKKGLLDPVSINDSCRCERCYEPDCTICTGRVCCYTCGDQMTVQFGTITISGGATGFPYYDTMADFAATISGQLVNLDYDGVFTRFLLRGNVTQVDTDFAYFWQIEGRPGLPDVGDARTRTTPRINICVIKIERFCLDVGDPVEGDKYCAHPDVLSFTQLAQPSIPLSFGAASGQFGNCCEFTGTWDVTNQDASANVYFSTAEAPTSLDIDTCSLCDATDYPSSLSFDLSQLTGGCYTSVSGTLVINQIAGFLQYIGSGSGVTVEIIASISFANPCKAGECYWHLRVTQGGCSVVYVKCSGSDDPTGTYTELGGSSTVDVT
jgi:hypothetical protein